MELPLEIRNAIENELYSQSIKKIAELAEKLSNNYRSGVHSRDCRFLQTPEEILAYVAFRLPGTYAAIYSALSQIKERSLGWEPKTVLDVGAGPGTGMWAALNLWPNMERITLLEREKYMIELGKKFAAYSNNISIQKAQWINVDITDNWNIIPHDLVIASYILNELPQGLMENIINKLWENTADILVIIEPGTPAGFERIKQAREQLINLGAKTIAPCPHNYLCPMDKNDWCHFSQRISRSKLHRLVKSGELAYEDEKFSYVCMSRIKETKITTEGIVIRHPQIRKGHILLELCTIDGIRKITVTRKDKNLFKKARKLKWGSML
ncbi:MAG TPA: rRNA methyltransferase [Clostridiaceae bacterium]|nr:rRNA methyltransferase [Clostridiaceae bacterium]